jgi:hypothetical protein
MKIWRFGEDGTLHTMPITRYIEVSGVDWLMPTRRKSRDPRSLRAAAQSRFANVNGVRLH